jgi:hypothetical protein
MARQHIEHTAVTAAAPATVYALLLDGASWPAWGPIDAFALVRPGADEPEGVGAVRELRAGRVTGRDEIVELVPDRRLSYTHTSSLPVRDYRGDVDLEPVSEGTRIRWAVAFDPKWPGTGPFVRRGLDGFIAKLTDGLARHAAEIDAAQRPAA